MSCVAKDWLQNVLPLVPTAGEEIVLQVLKNVIREFYRESRAWRYNIGPIDSKPNDSVYALNPLTKDYRVVWVRRVWWTSTIELTPVAAVNPSRQEIAAAPHSYYCPEPDIVCVMPTPTEVVPTLSFVVSVSPIEATQTYPATLYTHYYDTIRAGVLAELLGYPKKPYTNFRESRRHYAKFLAGISDARASSDRYHTPAQETWTFPRTFA